MPTVFRIGPYRVVIFTNDHRPAHVHIIRGQGDGEAEAVFFLNCPDGPPELREVRGLMAFREANLLEDLLMKRLDEPCEKWSEIHGDY